MKDLLKNFVCGLRDGLFVTSGASLLIAAGAILLAFFVVRPGLLAKIPYELLLVSDRDLDIQAIQKALDLRSSAPSPLGVTIIGASSIHHALLQDTEIQTLLTDKLGTEVSVTKITTQSIRPFDLARFIDYLPEGYRGIVIFSISLEHPPHPPRYMKNIKKSADRFPLPSPTFKALAAKHEGMQTPETRIYLLDHIRFFGLRTVALVKSLQLGPLTPVVFFMEGIKVSERSRKELKNIKSNVRTLANNYRIYGDGNFDVLADLYAGLINSHISVVFIHPPRNIDFIQPIYQAQGNGDHLDKLDNRYRRFSKENGGTYWNFNNAALYRLDDFRDHSHISNSKARTRYTEMLIDNLAEMIYKKFSPVNE